MGDVPWWQAQRVRSTELRELADDAAEGRGDFEARCEGEMDRIGAVVSARRAALGGAIAVILRSRDWSGTGPARAAVDGAAADARRLDGFARAAVASLDACFAYADRVSGGGGAPGLLASLARRDWTGTRTGDALPALSACYHALRRSAEQRPAPAENVVWRPPDSFVRSTRKYVVRPGDVLRLKLAILKHLPLLVFGESEDAAVKSAEPFTLPPDGAPAPNVAAQRVSSTYIDNPEKLTQYHERLRRDNGARLVRLRWYGESDPNAADTTVYVERKVHGEDWAGATSVKERYSVEGGAAVSRLFASGPPPPGEGNAPEKSKREALEDEVRTLISDRTLRPLVRSVYFRSAFQRSDDNAVRISLDTSLTFLDDTLVPSGGAWVDAASCDECALLEEVLHGREVSAGERELRVGHDGGGSARFPFAVLEVKLSDAAHPPDWITDLLSDFSTDIVEMRKFSKYLTGCALLHAGACERVPYWFCDDGAMPSDVRDLVAADEKQFEIILAPTKNDAAAPKRRQRRASRSRILPEEMIPLVPLDGGAANAPDAGKVARESAPPGGKKAPPVFFPARVEPKVYFANERTFIQWMGVAMLLTTLSLALISLETRTAFYTGMTTAPVAIGFLWYALYVYYWRLRKIARKDSSSYDDRVGPFVLVMAITLAVCVALSFEIPEEAEDLRKALKKDTGKATSAGIGLRSSFGGSCRLVVGAADDLDCFAGQCATVSALLRPSSATFVPSAPFAASGTLYAASIFGLLVVDLDGDGKPTGSRTVTVPNYDLEASAPDPSNADVLWLGAEAPSNAILEYSLVTDRVFRSYEPGGSATLEGLAWAVPDETGADPVLWASDDLGIYAVTRSSATYQWSKVNEISSVLMADVYCAACDGLASNIADLDVVDRLLFVMVDDHPARVLIAIDMDTGAKMAEHRLPDTHDSWEGIEIVPDADADDEYKVYLARDHPPQIWQLTYSLTQGFTCA